MAMRELVAVGLAHRRGLVCILPSVIRRYYVTVESGFCPLLPPFDELFSQALMRTLQQTRSPGCRVDPIGSRSFSKANDPKGIRTPCFQDEDLFRL